MYIGYMGDIVFTVSEDYMLTMTGDEQEGSGRWAEHALLMRKPVSQFGGPGLEKLSFSVILSAAHGVNPATQLEKFRRMRDTGAVFPLVIGGKPVSQGYWRLDSVKRTGSYYLADGQLMQCTAQLSLTEYNDANGIEGNAVTIRYGTEDA